NGALGEVFRAHWWAAVAAVAGPGGDLEGAEDAGQEACAAALAQWPADGPPDSPRGWVIGAARPKGPDRGRRGGAPGGRGSGGGGTGGRRRGGAGPRRTRLAGGRWAPTTSLR